MVALRLKKPGILGFLTTSAFVAVGLSLLVAGCAGRDSNGQSSTLILATTTSTRDSGLLDVLLPIFEQETGIGVKVVAVGSGQALAMGRRGDADVLLTHSPRDEEKFIAEGHALFRKTVMYNDFVIVGPPTDPAQVQQASSASDAFRRIARSQHRFVSRADDSGTHRKEQEIWQQAGITPRGDWYLEAGAGMAQVLRAANELRAYTLSDRSTFLFQKRHLSLVILFQGDPSLRNRYSVLVIDPARHPHVRVELAKRFADFLLSPRTQRLIGEYGRSEFGQPLFQPVLRSPSATRSPQSPGSPAT